MSRFTSKFRRKPLSESQKGKPDPKYSTPAPVYGYRCAMAVGGIRRAFERVEQSGPVRVIARDGNMLAHPEVLDA